MHNQSPNNVKSIYEEIEINERLIFGFIYSIVLIVCFLIACLCHLKTKRDEFKHKNYPYMKLKSGNTIHQRVDPIVGISFSKLVVQRIAFNHP